ncbi:tyrosine-type recombinase/integrase [Actinoplanes sp. NPDC049118]|uniref:tyrosine-type recombinase/integrase n=1 Tax=Actinoplanes sp. NPDC049118 TaxID=3155769 RepID=UPI0033C86A7A
MARRRRRDGHLAHGSGAAAEDGEELIPVMRDEDTKKLLDFVRAKKDFSAIRDEALIRLYYNTGARLSEIGNLLLTDVDMNTQSVHLHGKGAKDRRVRFGAKTARAMSHVHAHRWRHNFAHEWHKAGGDTGDLMLLLGWSSEDMPRHYGASAAAERAQELQTSSASARTSDAMWPGPAEAQPARAGITVWCDRQGIELSRDQEQGHGQVCA